jgi:hypothetical protein
VLVIVIELQYKRCIAQSKFTNHDQPYTKIDIELP